MTISVIGFVIAICFGRNAVTTTSRTGRPSSSQDGGHQYLRLFMTGIGLCGIVCILFCAQPALLGASAFEIEVPVERITDRSGLRLVLSMDTTAPVVSLCVAYDVGSRCDGEGKSGIAHLVEHLMFRGSQNVDPGEHASLIRSVGGFHTASTNVERTSYCQSVPSMHLERLMTMELDRMLRLEITQEDLELARKVVLREIRERAASATRYTQDHVILRALGGGAYGRPPVGRVDDLNSITLSDAKDFWATHYRLDNSVMVVVGNFQRSQVLRYLRNQLKRTDRDVSMPSCVVPPFEADAVRTSNLHSPSLLHHGKTSGAIFTMAYRIPAVGSADWYAVGLAGDILGDGRGSILHANMVKSRRIASDVSWRIQHRRSGTLGIMQVKVPRIGDLPLVQSTTEQIIRRQLRSGIPKNHLARVKMKFVRSTSDLLRPSFNRAVAFADSAIIQRDAGSVNVMISKFIQVDRTKVEKALENYLHPDDAYVMHTLPWRVE